MKSSFSVIFPCVFLLLNLEFTEEPCYHWHVNYNIHIYNRDFWASSLRRLNHIEIYNLVIPSFDKVGKDLNAIQDNV